MKILDAMACGLPVIAPLFGGPTDFCTPTNAFPVDFSLGAGRRLPRYAVAANHEFAGVGRARRREPGVAAPAGGRRPRGRAPDRRAGPARGDRPVDLGAGARSSPASSARLSGSNCAPRAASRGGGRATSRAIAVLDGHPRQRRRADLQSKGRAAKVSRVRSSARRSFRRSSRCWSSTTDRPTARGRWSRRSTFAYKLSYHHQTNQGPGAARNEGIQLAAGELVLIIGDDILADERLLEEHLELTRRGRVPRRGPRPHRLAAGDGSDRR